MADCRLWGVGGRSDCQALSAVCWMIYFGLASSLCASVSLDLSGTPSSEGEQDIPRTCSGSICVGRCR